MENTKISVGTQIALGVIALSTAMLNFKGCDSMGQQKEINDLKWINRTQSDSIAILLEQNNQLDSLRRALKLENAVLRDSGKKCNEKIDAIKKITNE